MSRNTHDRGSGLHLGYEVPSAIEIEAALGAAGIGLGGAGATLYDMLVLLHNAITDRERRFYADAVIDFLSTYFTADAYLVLTTLASLTGNATLLKVVGAPASWAWTNRLSSNSSDQLKAVAYGNKLWTAVGRNSRMYTAPENVPLTPASTWTGRTGISSLGTFVLWDVAFDGTTWVVVGDRLHTATDPTSTWTLRLTPSQFLQFVTFANNNWVAGGGSGGTKVLYTAGATPTGTWTSRSTSNFAGANQIVDVKFGNSLWVGISGTKTVATATDPTSTWTNRGDLTASTATVNSIVYGNGHWVAAGQIGTTGTVWINDNPTTVTTWNSVSISGLRQIQKIIYADDQFIVGGVNASFLPRVFTAPNPWGPWTSHTPSTVFATGFLIGHDGLRTLVAVGDDGDSAHARADVTYTTSPTELHSDSVLKKTLSSSFLADAFIPGRFTANADLLKTITGSFTANAVAKTISNASLTADAALAGRLFADAVILRTGTGSFSADAEISNGHFTLDAYIIGGDFQFDAFQFNAFQ